MDAEAILTLILHANRLKRMPRTGWVIRGLTGAESVADHIFGTAFIALVLAELVAEPVDRGKLLAMILLHDLPESLTTDLPQPVVRFFPPDAKPQAELNALMELLQGVGFGERFRAWWQAAKDEESIEARILRDADRLELLVQAYVYGRMMSGTVLDEFWEGQEERPFKLEVSQRLFAALLERRRQEQRGRRKGRRPTRGGPSSVGR
ncbi:MAG: phosphohydrolase [Chloroflexota bacterium]